MVFPALQMLTGRPDILVNSARIWLESECWQEERRRSLPARAMKKNPLGQNSMAGIARPEPGSKGQNSMARITKPALGLKAHSRREGKDRSALGVSVYRYFLYSPHGD